jgi:hypothetical protein
MIAAGTLPSDVPPDFGYITDAAQKQAQQWLARFVPKTKHITNTNSGHDIHKEQSQLVIDSIRKVVEAFRTKKPVAWRTKRSRIKAPWREFYPSRRP